MKKIGNIIFVGFIVMAAFATFLPLADAAAAGARVERGVIDLRTRDFDKDGPVNLNGDWEFYWDRLLSPGEVAGMAKSGPPRFATLPGAWNGQVIDGKKLPGDGCATYRSTILLDAAKYPRLAVKIEYCMSPAYELFVNGRKIGGSGTVSATRGGMTPRWIPEMFSFEADAGRLEMVLKVSNFHHNEGGVRYPVLLGTEQQISRIRMNGILSELFLLGTFTIIGLYHLGIFAIRRKDISSLLFGSFCLILALRLLVSGEFHVLHIVPSLPWAAVFKLEYLVYYSSQPIFTCFIASLFPDESSRVVTGGIVIIGAVFTLVAAAFPPGIVSSTLYVYQVTTLLTVIYLLYMLIRALINRRDGALYIIIGATVLFLAVINDILRTNQTIDTVFLAPFGLFIFIFSQSFVLYLKFSRAFSAVENLSLELDEKNRNLEKLDKLKDEFLANTSHELKTPLHGIIGLTESVMAGAAGPVGPDAMKNLGMILASSRRLTSMVNDILDYSRLKFNDIILQKKPVDLKAVAEGVIASSRMLAVGKNVRLVNSIPGELPPADGDENRIIQILYNLVGNAVKFTEEGTVEITAAERGQSVEITVSDTGIGIPEDKQKVIFNAFEQADGTITREFGGTGLGLSITKKLVELHGGDIRVESSPGSGSRFIFRIPAHLSATGTGATARHGVEPLRGDEASHSEVHFAADAGMPRTDGAAHLYRVLAVDDDPVNLQVIANHLAGGSCRVDTASNGIDAIAMVEAADRGGSAYDLVLLDIMMPRMSGFDVTAKLREKYPLFRLPIVILTVRNRESDIVTAFEAGANDYLVKPFNRSELTVRVNTHIMLKRAVFDHDKLIALENQLAIARMIQRSTMPGGYPRVEGLSLVAKCIPTDLVGGDLYDFCEIDGGRVGILVADVAGHGVPAALIASMVKIVFYMLRDLAGEPEKLVTQMNMILRDNIAQQFVTAGYACIDRGAGKVLYARTGHEPLIMIRKGTGTVEHHLPAGRMIGFAGENRCTTMEVRFDAGDRIILYSDGITECRDSAGKIFGNRRFEEFIQSNRECVPGEFADKLIAELTEFSGTAKFSDDITLVVVDVL